MSLYKYELFDKELDILHKWAKNKEWSDIKKQIYIMIKNHNNKKYIKEHENANNDIYPLLLKLFHKMEIPDLINFLKTPNAYHTGGYYPYVSNHPLQGGINFGKLASLAKSKASAMGKQVQSQLREQGKQLANQASEYAQQQTQHATQYVQQQAQEYIKQQALRAQQYAQQQALQAQQYAQQQAQQLQQKFENKVTQAGKQLQGYLAPYTQTTQGYIAGPSVTPPISTLGYVPTVAPGLMPLTVSDTSAQSLESPVPQSTGLVESVFDFAGNIGEKVMGF